MCFCPTIVSSFDSVPNYGYFKKDWAVDLIVEYVLNATNNYFVKTVTSFPTIVLNIPVQVCMDSQMDEVVLMNYAQN